MTFLFLHLHVELMEIPNRPSTKIAHITKLKSKINQFYPRFNSNNNLGEIALIPIFNSNQIMCRSQEMEGNNLLKILFSYNSLQLKEEFWGLMGVTFKIFKRIILQIPQTNRSMLQILLEKTVFSSILLLSQDKKVQILHRVSVQVNKSLHLSLSKTIILNLILSNVILPNLLHLMDVLVFTKKLNSVQLKKNIELF